MARNVQPPRVVAPAPSGQRPLKGAAQPDIFYQIHVWRFYSHVPEKKFATEASAPLKGEPKIDAGHTAPHTPHLS
eukprot:2719565-Prymnesium_polylepis.1